MEPVEQVNKNYFELELKILKACGVSLRGNNSTLYNIYAFILLLIAPYSYLVLAVIDLFKGQDIDNLSTRLVFDGCMFLDAVKVAVELLNRKKLTKILDSLHRGYFAVNPERGGEDEEKLLKGCIRFNTIQRNCYFTILTVCVTASAIYSFSTRVRSSDHNDWELSFGSFTILNITYSPNFEITMLFQDVACIVGAVQFMITDLLFCNIVAHLCVQFKLLQNSLKRLIENSFRRMAKATGTTFMDQQLGASSIGLKYLQKTLKEAVLHHLGIMNITAEVENIYSGLLLIIYLGNMVIFCFGLYNCSVVSIFDPEMRSVGTCMLVVWFQSLVICYWCNDLTWNSEEVRFAVYNTDFVGTHLSFQRDLALIMRRSLSPTVITAGKFFGITLTPFVKAQQIAYSSFMVLRKKSSIEA